MDSDQLMRELLVGKFNNSIKLLFLVLDRLKNKELALESELNPTKRDKIEKDIALMTSEIVTSCLLMYGLPVPDDTFSGVSYLVIREVRKFHDDKRSISEFIFSLKEIKNKIDKD